MKEYLLIMLTGILNLGFVRAQIPNGGFELWEGIDNYEKPLNWSTNQDTFYTRMVKDSISVEGKYSMKLIPSEDLYLHGCESWAGTHVNFDSALPSNSQLKFYIKIVPEDPDQSNDVYLRVGVLSFDSNAMIGSSVWETLTSIEDFTRIDIPLEGENIEALDIIIYGAGSSNPLDGPCHNRSFAWIDGIAIDSNLTGTTYSTEVSSTISIYPNPSTGLVHINSPTRSCVAYELYSTIGELISKGKIENDQLIIREHGTFMLRLITDADGLNEYHCKLVIVE